MTLPPASLPAAASVPISVPSSGPFRTAAAARQASGQVSSRENPAKTNSSSHSRAVSSSSGETEAAEGAGDSAPEQAFAEIIQQMSLQAKAPAAQASAPAPQAPTANADAGFFRAWQVAGVSSTPVVTAPTQGAVAASATDKRQPAVSASRSAIAATAPLAKEPAQNVPPVPIDIVTALAPVKPKLAELNSGGGVAETQLKPHEAQTAASQPEAALTVVIRSSDQTPAAAPQAGQFSANQPESIAPAEAPVTKPESPDTSTSAPPAGTAQIPSAAQVSGYEAVAPVSAASAHADAESHKATTAESAVTPDITVAQSAGTQTTAAFQDLQLKAEPARTDNAAPRNEAQKAPAAPAEPPAPEKGAAQPLKSVALEFTPDGARDVKVRLSERGGEVHVSVHSTDPSVTKNLRAGVSDLASVLEHAGYDAKAWAGGRQQQENPQQQQQTSQRRNNRTGAPAEQFDSIVQQPNQENS